MFLWNNVVIPLSICLLILIIVALIVGVFNVIESIIYTKFEEWRIRREQKQQKKILANLIMQAMIDETPIEENE